jgi:hypothetical protein
MKERRQDGSLDRVRVGTFHGTVIRHLQAINSSRAKAKFPAINQFPFDAKGRLSFLAPGLIPEEPKLKFTILKILI